MSGVVVVNQVNTQLVNAAGLAIMVPDGYAITSDNAAILISGTDGTNAQFIRVASDGTIRIDPTGSTVQPVSGTIVANQGNTWTVQMQDGYGRSITALTGTPTGTETGIVTRNIPSGTQTISGTVAISSVPASVATEDTLQSIDGYVASIFQHSVPTADTRSVVAASVSAVTLLSANTARKGATIFNDAAIAVLKIALGAADVSATDFTVAMVAGSYYETPFGFTGRISGIWDVASGAARIGEIT